MECDSEYRRLASRNRYILDLEKQCYAVDFVGGHLIIYGLPYLDSEGNLAYGDIASPVDLKDGYEIDRPKSHQVWFRGSIPYDVNGRPLRISAVNSTREVTSDFVCPISFSLKVQGRDYESFEEKLTTYIHHLTAPAREKYDATPQSEIRVKATEIGSPLQFPDTLSARDGVNDIAKRLEGVKVAIVGAGGTGSYILDFLAKTRVKLLRIYDDDIVHVHTLFRFPGAVGNAALGKKKVDVLCDIYTTFHGAIDPRPVRITQENVSELAQVDFVFIAVDDGPSRDLIVRQLTACGVPFVDVGMGLYRASDRLDGMLRMAGGDLADGPALLGTEYLPTQNPPDNEYRRQPQLGELNALNAGMAVVRFKQALGLFGRACNGHAEVFEIGTFELDHYRDTDAPN